MIEHYEEKHRPAFPSRGPGNEWFPGLTKREYFAALALQAIISSQTSGLGKHDVLYATLAVNQADELMRALEIKK